MESLKYYVLVALCCSNLTELLREFFLKKFSLVLLEMSQRSQRSSRANSVTPVSPGGKDDDDEEEELLVEDEGNEEENGTEEEIIDVKVRFSEVR